jgi:hypothetical protein
MGIGWANGELCGHSLAKHVIGAHIRPDMLEKDKTMYYDMSHDNYAYSGNEGHNSDDYVPYYADYEYEENLPDSDMSDKDWFTTPSGNKCPWCKDGLTSPFEPEDEDDAEMSLCRGHAAEYAGLSLDGMDRRDSEESYDML